LKIKTPDGTKRTRSGIDFITISRNYKQMLFNKNNIKRIYSEAAKKQKRIKFECFKDGCSELAIDSHSQSLANALKRISQRSHVVGLEHDFFRSNRNKIDSCFKKIGIKHASKFRGFCKGHDNEFFKAVDNIDQKNINKENLARLAFRTLAYEERTKEKVVCFLEYIVENAKEICDISFMQLHVDGIRNHLEVTRPYYIDKFIKMFKSQNYEQIHGVVFILNKMLPISCATVIDPTMLDSENLMEGDLRDPLNVPANTQPEMPARNKNVTSCNKAV